MDVLVARQAIFDRERRVYGYELLFRSDAGRNEFDGTEGGLATKQVLANSLLVIGLENLVGVKKAFVNFGRGPLLQGLYASLPRASTVIELLETVEPDSEVLEACRKLRKEGYQLALDDFMFRPSWQTCSTSPTWSRSRSKAFPLRALLVRSCKARGLQLLAEKVETHEEFEWARQAGYDYFQGYFFARPVIVQGRKIPSAIPLPAFVAGSATPGIGFRAPGKADPGRRFALLSIAALRQLAFVRVDQQRPVHSSGLALFWRNRTAQMDCPGNPGAYGGG